jgi:hypothetical protein
VAELQRLLRSEPIHTTLAATEASAVVDGARNALDDVNEALAFSRQMAVKELACRNTSEEGRLDLGRAAVDEEFDAADEAAVIGR